MQRRRNKRRTQKKRRLRIVSFVLFMVIIIGVFIHVDFIYETFIKDRWNEYRNIYSEVDESEMALEQPEMDVQLLTINEYSRPGTKTGNIQNIVIHYVANPGSTAEQNRDYFEGLKDSKVTKASSNFIIGLDGEIVQCVPTWEVAYASNEANLTSVSIECCHLDETGEFNKKTYESAVDLTAWLCEKFGLSEEDVIRHYDVTGKNCPKYYVENEAEWEEFRADVKAKLE